MNTSPYLWITLLSLCCSCENTAAAPSTAAGASVTTAAPAVPQQAPTATAGTMAEPEGEDQPPDKEWDADDEAPDSDEPAPSASPSEEEPPDSTVSVKIENVGMRIAGGPNDKRSKAPIRKAITDSHGAIAACFQHVDNKKKGGTFGLDIRIGRKGGQAKVRDVRTRLGNKAFRKCVVEAFEQIEFPKPPGGKPTVVSYSIRFVPSS